MTIVGRLQPPILLCLLHGGEQDVARKKYRIQEKEPEFFTGRHCDSGGRKPQAVSKWEKDLSSPSTENIIRLAEILRVSVEELTGGRPAAAGRDREDRSVYRVSDSRYLWLPDQRPVIPSGWPNPVLIFLYLEAWQTMYQLAYIGMLKRNLLWLSIYSFGILLFILEGAAAVYIAARRRVILGGEFLELSEEGIVVVDMSTARRLTSTGGK